MALGYDGNMDKAVWELGEMWDEPVPECRPIRKGDRQHVLQAKLLHQSVFALIILISTCFILQGNKDFCQAVPSIFPWTNKPV